jgi:hypothetical protein
VVKGCSVNSSCLVLYANKESGDLGRASNNGRASMMLEEYQTRRAAVWVVGRCLDEILL